MGCWWPPDPKNCICLILTFQAAVCSIIDVTNSGTDWPKMSEKKDGFGAEDGLGTMSPVGEADSPGSVPSPATASPAPGDPAPPQDGTIHKREQWTRKIDFLLACIGWNLSSSNWMNEEALRMNSHFNGSIRDEHPTHDLCFWSSTVVLAECKCWCSFWHSYVSSKFQKFSRKI